MSQSTEKGALASNQGKILEKNVESTFSAKGFTIVKYRVWNKNKANYGDELLLENCPFKNIYNHDGNTEFLLKSKKFNCEIRIECKWQQSNGSVDEKFPYLYLNCIEAMPEKEIVIIIDGGGAKAGSIEWLKNTIQTKKYTSDINNDKTIHVFNLTEFIQWANKRFR
ncbi:PD-(D/E)XK nuclease superfamily protein [Treponema pedis]|uniref:PD-(D/E)XK nuclease superfamily protein n=1 Tax=Treponema pedis TaxID=409322 RepID=UPI000494B635|nr:PD-(D/E)XK nuclease superfamily protein [Treponema pedis]